LVLNKDEIEKRAKEIFNLNEKIRFVAFTIENKLIFYSMREGVKSYSPNNVDVEIGELRALIVTGIFGKLKEYFGEIEYFLTKFKKVNLFIIPFSKGVLTMTTEPDYLIENLTKIKEVLNKI
jgi:hypothetical protein